MAKYATEDNFIRYTNALKANATILNRKTAYAVGDVVQKGNVFLKCITAGTTATTALTLSSVINTILTDGTVDWQVIDPFAETKIRDWESGVKYEVSRIVKYNGSLYRCLTTNMDATFTITNWELLVTGITDWVSGEDYVVGQFVVYNGVLYECTTANNDSTFNSTNWQKIAGGGLYTWAANTSYSVGDVVIYNNNIYQCNTTHTSGSAFNPDASKWTEISACITRIPNWVSNKNYVVGDLVANDAKIYRCTVSHTSGATFDNVEETNWEELSPTINEISMWAVSTNYAVGQLVIYNNKLYRCNTAHTSDSTSFNTDIAYWDEIGSSGGIEQWKANELYTQGNMVVYNDKIYICDTSHTSTNTFDNTKWHEISSNDIDNWQTSTSYIVGDMIVKDNQLYRCVTQHTSDSSDFSNDISNWQTLDTKWKAVNWVANTLYINGEVVLYDNTPIKCITTHISDSTYALDKDNWETLSANIIEWSSGTTYKVGDTVIYENEIWKCITANNDVSFRKDKWKQISKCNIEIWRGAPDTNILALLHMDNGNDLGHNEYGDRFTTSGMVQSEGKFGTGISLWNAAGSSITSPQYSFNSGETYTIEFWMKIRFRGYNLSYGYIGSLGTLVKDTQYTTTIFPGTAYSSTGFPAPNQTWNHYAYVISPTECKLYLNGSLYTSFTRPNSDPIYISFTAQNGDEEYGKGWIDELRITKKDVYTSNFTPQTEPYENPNFEGYKKDDLIVYEDKIYRCIEDNNDVLFTPSKWVEVSKSILYPDWSSDTDYSVDDIVIYQNQLYRCIISHTSTSDFNDDYDKWIPLDKNCFIHNWASNIPYYVGEVVKYNDELYRCKISHVSVAGEGPTNAKLYEASGNVIYVDDTTTIPYTETIDLGSIQKVTSISYNEVKTDMNFDYNIETSEDDITYTVWDGSSIESRYIRLTVESVSIDSGAISPSAYLDNFIIYGDNDKWELTSSSGGVDLPEWQANTSYTAGKYLVHEGTVYRVDNDFTSGTTFSDANLTAYIAPIMQGATSSASGKSGIVPKPTTTDVDKFLKGDGTWGNAGGGISIWQANTAYKVNDVVIDSNLIWQCATAHTSTTIFDESKWICISGGEISNGMEIIPLWEGSFNSSNSTNGADPTPSTPTIELNDSINNYEYIYVKAELSGGTESSSTVNTVPFTLFRCSILASPSYYASCSLGIYDNTHIYMKYANTDWDGQSLNVLEVKGIRKAKPIVSSGMKYETLWEGEAGSASSTVSVNILLSEAFTKFKKLGFYCKVNGNRRYYKELDSAMFSDFLINHSSDDAITLCWGYGNIDDYINIAYSSTSLQINVTCYKTVITKVVGISEGVVVPTGVQAARVTLWEGWYYATNPTVAGATNTQLLTDSLNNYDQLEISIVAGGQDSANPDYPEKSVLLIDVSDTIYNKNGTRLSVFANTDNYGSINIGFPDSTHFALVNLLKTFAYFGVTKIVGIKYIQPDSYSTEEKLIGTWIDGKPLYRKVFENPTNGMNTGLNNTDYNICRIYGSAIQSDNPSVHFDVPYFANGVGAWVFLVDGVLTTGASFGAIIKWVAIEYTKN